MEFIVTVLAIGVFATVIIDLWATFSNKVFKWPRTNWAMVGRWLGHIPKGQLMHSSISAANKVSFEQVIGWSFHYFIGVLYAGIYLAFIELFQHATPTLWSAWLFGLMTILSPWFIMQPSLGMGVCAAKAAQPNMVRLQNFFLHSIFGLALYFALAIQKLF